MQTTPGAISAARCLPATRCVARFAGGFTSIRRELLSRLGFWWDAGLALFGSTAGLHPRVRLVREWTQPVGPSRQVRVVHVMAEHLDNCRGSLKHHPQAITCIVVVGKPSDSEEHPINGVN